ncbi:hypothetical protein [Streptomyces sp. NPDC002746]
MSEQTRRTQTAAAGGSRKEGKKSSSPKVAAEQKQHIVIPSLNLGGDDDDDVEEEDNRAFLASLTARTSKPPEQSAAIPPQAESKPAPAVTADTAPSAQHEDGADTTRPPVSATSPSDPDAPDGGKGDHDEAGSQAPQQTAVGSVEPPTGVAVHKADETARTAPPDGPVSEPAVPEPVQGEAVSTAPAPTAAPREEAKPAQSPGAALARSSSEAGRGGAAGSAAEVYGGSMGSGVPARRPGRRRHREPYNPEQPRDNGVAAMQEMVERAPRYAALLNVYSAAQLKTMPFRGRNLHLYGLTADDAGLQSVADKAFLKTLTTQEPKLTIAHYADAALEPVLAQFNPEGTDREAMEDERDYLWDLAQKALEYRRYILSEPEASRMPKYRAKGMLRVHVDDRFSRMLNLMDSFAGIEAKPFEIVSWVLADYLRKLPEEQAELKDVFAKHVTTGTIQ